MQGSEKRTISESDRLQLVGLLALAKQGYERMNEIERAVGTLVGEEADASGYYGIASDAVWSDIAGSNPAVVAGNLLSRLGIEVSDAG